MWRLHLEKNKRLLQITYLVQFHLCMYVGQSSGNSPAPGNEILSFTNCFHLKQIFLANILPQQPSAAIPDRGK